MTQIDSFQGSYRWLSNFWPVKVKYLGVEYLSVEAAYQAAKSDDPEVRFQFCFLNPYQAKALGKKVTLRADWNDIKLSVMTGLLIQKFKDPTLAKALADTGDAKLIEGNTWGDTYWGVCRGVGQNHLGKALMNIRAMFFNSQEPTYCDCGRTLECRFCGDNL